MRKRPWAAAWGAAMLLAPRRTAASTGLLGSRLNIHLLAFSHTCMLNFQPLLSQIRGLGMTRTLAAVVVSRKQPVR
jgi:hypothetical protein